LIGLGAPWSLAPSSIALKPISRQDLYRVISQHHHNPRLVKAIIQVESGWDVDAVSHAGAVGLMQVMPESGKHWAGMTRRDLFCPVKNIIAGTKILKYYQRTSPNLKVALRKYSGGAKGYFWKVRKEMRRK